LKRPFIVGSERFAAFRSILRQFAAVLCWKKSHKEAKSAVFELAELGERIFQLNFPAFSAFSSTQRERQLCKVDAAKSNGHSVN